MGMFHWTGGLYFGRREDGSVRVVLDPCGFPSHNADSPHQGSSTLDVTIPAAEWASIVSYVSAGGEPANYAAADALHGA